MVSATEIGDSKSGVDWDSLYDAHPKGIGDIPPPYVPGTRTIGKSRSNPESNPDGVLRAILGNLSRDGKHVSIKEGTKEFVLFVGSEEVVGLSAEEYLKQNRGRGNDG